MKKLESLKNEKFSISDKDMAQIKGGEITVGDTLSFSSSWEDKETCINNVPHTDHTEVDVCVDDLWHY